MDENVKITKNYKLMGTESDPVIIAQRLLNLYRQLHIFSPEKKEAYNKMLLEQTPEVKKVLGTLPGGVVVQQYLYELEGGEDSAKNIEENKVADAGFNQDSPQPHHVEQPTVQPTVVSVANDPQMIKGIVDAFKEAIITSEKNRKEDTKELAQTIVALQSKVMQDMMTKMSNISNNATMSAASASKVETKVTTVETKVVNAEAATNANNFPVGQLEDIVAGISRAQGELIKEMAQTQTEQLSELISKVLKEIQQMSTQTLIDAVQTVHRENMDFFKNQIFSSVSKVPMEAHIAEQDKKAEVINDKKIEENNPKEESEKISERLAKKLKFPWDRNADTKEKETENTPTKKEEKNIEEIKVIDSQESVNNENIEVKEKGSEASATQINTEESSYEDLKNSSLEEKKQPEIKLFKFPWETENKSEENQQLENQKDDDFIVENVSQNLENLPDTEEKEEQENNKAAEIIPEETKNQKEFSEIVETEDVSESENFADSEELVENTELEGNNKQFDYQHNAWNEKQEVVNGSKEVNQPDEKSYKWAHDETEKTDLTDKSNIKNFLNDEEPVDLDSAIDSASFQKENNEQEKKEKQEDNSENYEWEYVEEPEDEIQENPLNTTSGENPETEAVADNGEEYEWEYVEESEDEVQEDTLNEPSEETFETEAVADNDEEYEWEYVEEPEDEVQEDTLNEPSEETFETEAVADNGEEYEWDYVEEPKDEVQEDTLNEPSEETSETEAVADNGEDYEWEYAKEPEDEIHEEKFKEQDLHAETVSLGSSDEKDPYNPTSENANANLDNPLLVNNKFLIKEENNKENEIVLDDNFGLTSNEETSSQPM